MIYLSVNNPIEKGKAFEEFIAILLSKLGYKIDNVRIRKSGRELDILASSKVTNSPILIECKAEDKSIRGPAFSKFYGVYDHEYRTQKISNLTGLMLSLSGFNSEVIEYYNEKDDEVKQRFQLRGPDQIVKLTVEADLISDDLTVRHIAQNSWPFELGATLLVITRFHLYRVQLLGRDGKITHFVVYRAKCEVPTDYEIETLHKNLPVLKNLEALNLLARRKILLALAHAEEALSISDLIGQTNQSQATIESELIFLKNQHLIEQPRENRVNLVYDIRALCEIFKEFVGSSDKYNFLMSPYFGKMNNVGLAEYCFSRRDLAIESPQELSVLNSLFRFSPSALNAALFGETGSYRVTSEHAKKIGADTKKINDLVKSNFFTEIGPHLLNDLHDSDNSILKVLPSVVGLLEEYHIAFANTWETFFDIRFGAITARYTASKDMIAGQLVSTTDVLTTFNSAMTRFNLTKRLEAIEELEQLYAEFREKRQKPEELPKLANNIGICYMVIEKFQDARKWFEEGLSQCNDIPQLHGNLAKVLKAIDDLTGYSYHLTKAKEIDPHYSIE